MFRNNSKKYFGALIAGAVMMCAGLSASAAIVEVQFAGAINQSYDQGGDEITGDFFDIFGIFYVDTSAPGADGFGNYPGSVFGLDVYRDGSLLLTQQDFTCAGSCADSMFVSDSQETNIYVQDFYVGNLDLNLAPAAGATFGSDIDVFVFAAQGNVADYFDISNSFGSVQVDGEDYFDLYDLTMTEVSQVPLPAAAWLLISAIGGLVVAKRKQLKA